MTLNQFYVALSSMPRRLRRLARKYIKVHTLDISRLPCPIACLYSNFTKDDNVASDEALKYAKILRLSTRDAKKIMDAADFNNTDSKKLISIRYNMLNSLED